jgi:very-short-patch-repair endonuclease
MSNLLILLAVFTVLAVIAALLKKQSAGPSEDVTYEARRKLFSAAERSFLGVLEQAVAGQFRVMGKVRLGDLIQPVKGFSTGKRTGAWNRIHQKHVDFVLCRPDTLDVAAVVELDDASHRRKDRAERDEFVDKALSTAGIPIVHFAVCKGYSVQEITAKLAEVLPLSSESSEPVALSGVVPVVHEPLESAAWPVDEMIAENVTVKMPQDQASEQVAPICSACSFPMVKRLAKKGPNAGKWFWACSAFPKCRKVQAIG